MNSDLDDLFDSLARSPSRRRFRLGVAEPGYLGRRGLEPIMSHGEAFIEQRLTPADIPNDGKQTPMRNHGSSSSSTGPILRRLLVAQGNA